MVYDQLLALKQHILPDSYICVFCDACFGSSFQAAYCKTTNCCKQSVQQLAWFERPIPVMPTKVPMTHVYVWAKALAAPVADAHHEPGDSNGIQGAVVA